MASEYLARFYIPQRDLFDVNSTANRQSLNAFYTNNLCEVSRVRADYLLRDWSEIPGRDASPRRRRESSDLPLSLSPETEEDAALNERENITEKMLTETVQVGSSPERLVSAEVNDELALQDRTLTESLHNTKAQPVIYTDESDNAKESTSKSPQIMGISSSRRSASPDMFACDSHSEDDESAEKNTSPDPPCSLQPEDSSKSSGTMPSPTSEEDRLIELYNKEAETRNCTTQAINSDTNTPSSGASFASAIDVPAYSSDVALMMSLCYSGDSEGSTPLPSTLPFGNVSCGAVKQVDSESLTLVNSPAVQVAVAVKTSEEDCGSSNTETDNFDTCNEDGMRVYIVFIAIG